MEITLKLLSFLAVTLVTGSVAAASFIMMIVLMNGFQERDANWGIYIFIALTVIVTIVSAVLSIFGTMYLHRKRKMSLFGSAALSVAVCCILGAIGNIAGIFVGIFAAGIASGGL